MTKEFDFKIIGYIALIVVVGACVGSIANQFAPKGIPPPTSGDPSIQAGVASNTPLTTISMNDPNVVQAIDSSVPGAVSGAAGSIGNVKGKLTNIIYPRTASTDMILCFGSDANCTQVHVQGANFSKLPDVRNYLGHTLLVEGNVENGLHLPYVTVSDASNIKEVQ